MKSIPYNIAKTIPGDKPPISCTPDFNISPHSASVAVN
jgi:hypothetical protein